MFAESFDLSEGGARACALESESEFSLVPGDFRRKERSGLVTDWIDSSRDDLFVRGSIAWSTPVVSLCFSRASFVTFLASKVPRSSYSAMSALVFVTLS